MTENVKPKKEKRPPVIAIMGHIDHGKSTLLDYIRESNVAEGEAGGITQHISAYEVEHKTSEGVESKITFLDTPGHEAFSAIRARGVRVADIAILIVSAEDGVKPQTIEALKAIKDEGIPYIVAINKIDKPGANIDRTKQNLAENEIYIEGWGGDVPAVPISAKTGEGVPDLLDMMVLLADLEDLDGDRSENGTGIIIESNMDPKKGISATLIIKDGTLNTGTYIASGDSSSPVRIMEDFLGNKLESASFSSPIRIIGWNKLPEVGSVFLNFDSKKEAENFVKENEVNIKKTERAKLPETDEGKRVIPLIIRTDTAGSCDAVVQEIAKIDHDERIVLHTLYTDIGSVSESDIKTACSHPDTIILAFHTDIDPKAIHLAERMDVEVKDFNIIYKLTEWLEEVLKERTPLSDMEETIGSAKILKTFSKTKNKYVVGGKVKEGKLSVGDKVKIKRLEEEIGNAKITELQQQKSKVTEITDGEFGMMIESDTDIAEGDIIVSFKIVRK